MNLATVLYLAAVTAVRNFTVVTTVTNVTDFTAVTAGIAVTAVTVCCSTLYDTLFSHCLLSRAAPAVTSVTT